MRKLFFLVFLFLSITKVHATKVTYSGSTLVGEGTCYKLLSVISIEEGADGDFKDTTATNKTYAYAIKLPAGFDFRTTAGSTAVNYVSVSGAAPDFSTKNFSYSGNDVTGRILRFEYTLGNSATGKGKITIGNIEVICTKVGSYGPILRYDATGVDEPMVDNDPADKQVHGFLDSRINSGIKASAYKPYTNYYYATYDKTIDATTTSPTPYTNCTGELNYYYFYLSANPVGVTISKYYYYEYRKTPAVDRLLDSTTSYGSSRIYRPLYSLNGTYHYYSIAKDNNGCLYASKDTLNIKHVASPGPGVYEYDYTDIQGNKIKHDTIFAKSDEPKLLNGYINYPTGSPNDVVGYYSYPYAGVENLGSGTYIFTPGIAPNNVFPVYYIAKNATCSTRYAIPRKFTVYDPSESPASWIELDNDAPPFCENKGDIRFKVTAPDGYYINDFYFYNPTTSTYASYYSWDYMTQTYNKSKLTLPDGGGWYTLNTTAMKLKNVNSVSIYCSFRNIQDDSYFTPNVYYERTSISVFPKRGVKILGLPPASFGSSTINDSTIYLCGSSKDTLYTRFGPENGRMDFYKVIAGKDYKMSNPIGLSSSSDPYFRKIIPYNLFTDSCYSDTSIYIKIKYKYPGSSYNNQCPDSVIKTIKFFKPIDVNYSIISPAKEPYCFGEQITFKVNSFTNGDKFLWTFGDGYVDIVDSSQIKNYFYSRPGQYVIRFKTKIKALENGACNNDILDTIRVGAMPIADFDIYENFIDTLATLKSLSKITVKNPNAKVGDEDDIMKWSWDFGVGAGYVDETGTTTTKTYNATSRSPYPIIHKVTSGWGCVDSIIKPTPVFKVEQPLKSNYYSEDFNDTNKDNSWFASGWYKRDTLRSSWDNGIADGNTIIGQTPSWNTLGNSNNNSSDLSKKFIARYDNEEISWVESPVFNLDSLTLPMLSLDTWVNSDNSFDGACLQYTICDSVAFGREKWKMVGTYNNGVNWYNSYTVISRPKGWSLDGWSGTDAKGWSFSASELDQVISDLVATGNKLVRFRILFTSNQDNFPNKNLDGFAFDNFFLGQRNRRVIIEEFCDYSKLDKEDTLINTAPIFDANQTIKIQYHTSLFHNDDVINNQNPDEPSARALHYGIGKALPRGVIDGIIYDNSKPISEWGPSKLMGRTLEISPFEVSVNAKNDGDSLKITAVITKNGGNNLSARNYIVQLAVVEKEVIGNKSKVYTNVLRNLLPNAAGTRIDQAVSWNTTTVTHSWRPFVAPNSDFNVVAFLQDEDTKEIYQANLTTVKLATVNAIFNSKSGYVQENPVSFNEMYISPNPVTEDLRVLFNGVLNDSYKWVIFDIYGRVIQSGNFNQGINMSFIDTRNLSSGIYHLQLEGEGRVLKEKFAVVK